jgi:hypothetical protein
MCRRDRPGLDYRRKLDTLLVIQDQSPSWRLACRQPIRATLVEPEDPVAHDLQRDAGNLRRFATAPAVQNQGQRQQSPDLICISNSSR